MSLVNSIGPASVVRVEPVVRAAERPAADAAVVAAPVDTVDLSERARLLDGLRQGVDVRHDLVERVKGEIEAGTYLTDERLDRALDALIEDLLG
jgi:anti-sigma28 factor (negative regulator of flagellin synthesis)